MNNFKERIEQSMLKLKDKGWDKELRDWKLEYIDAANYLIWEQSRTIAQLGCTGAYDLWRDGFHSFHVSEGEITRDAIALGLISKDNLAEIADLRSAVLDELDRKMVEAFDANVELFNPS